MEDDLDQFQELFKQIFGAPSKQAGGRGRNLTLDIELTAEEAAEGTKKTIDVPRPVDCPECSGSGTQGQHVEGQTRRTACTRCQGQGMITAMLCLEVKIPSGVREGVSLRLAGQGEVGTPSGDLFCVIRIRERLRLFGRLKGWFLGG
jgi:DnaJ-class molecular chaperone